MWKVCACVYIYMFEINRCSPLQLRGKMTVNRFQTPSYHEPQECDLWRKRSIYRTRNSCLSARARPSLGNCKFPDSSVKRKQICLNVALRIQLFKFSSLGEEVLVLRYSRPTPCQWPHQPQINLPFANARGCRFKSIAYLRYGDNDELLQPISHIAYTVIISKF